MNEKKNTIIISTKKIYIIKSIKNVSEIYDGIEKIRHLHKATTKALFENMISLYKYSNFQ